MRGSEGGKASFFVVSLESCLVEINCFLAQRERGRFLCGCPLRTAVPVPTYTLGISRKIIISTFFLGILFLILRYITDGIQEMILLPL